MAHLAPHHKGPRYRKLGGVVVQLAKANPLAICHHCGRTLDQHPPGDTWERGHTVAGARHWRPWLNVERMPPTTGSWLAPAASSCQRREGAERARAAVNEPHSERW